MNQKTNQNQRLMSLGHPARHHNRRHDPGQQPGVVGVISTRRCAMREWNGLTPTDLVFPFSCSLWVFLHIFAKKIPIRIQPSVIYKNTAQNDCHFAIGLGIAWFGMFLRGILNEKDLLEAVANFDHIRILGVMPRLALCCGVGATMALLIPHKTMPWIIGAMLADMP